jgi:hypothetical protein
MMAKRKKKTTPTPSNVLAQFNASPQQQATLVAQVIAAAVINSPAVVNAPVNTAPTPAAVQKVAQQIANVIAPTVAPNLPPAIIQSIILGTANAVVSNPQVKAADVGQTVTPEVIQKIADVVVKTPEVVKAVETVAPPASGPTSNSTQVYSGDFGDGGAVGAPVTTPTPIRTPTPVSTPTTTTTTTPTPTPTPTFETSGGGSQVFPGDFGDGGVAGTGVTPETYTSPVTPESTPGSTQVFPGDFGDGGAVGEFVTPATPTGPTGATGPTGSTGVTGLTGPTDLTDDDPLPTKSKRKYTYTDEETGDLIDVYEDDTEVIRRKGTKKLDAQKAADATSAAALAKRESAFDILRRGMQENGLGALADAAIDAIMKEDTDSGRLLALRSSPAYQLRFSANAQRTKNGFAAIDEATYLGLEDSFQSI